MKTNRLLTTVISVIILSAHSLFAQNTYVPDDNFEQTLIDLGYDSGILDDSVQTVNIETITSLNVNGKNISNLTGIKDFTSLTNLNCGNNNLTMLNLSNNLSLLELGCFNNQISTIDLSTNTNLTELVCYNNNLTEIDLSAVTALLTLNCSNNQLSSLDLSSNPFLTSLKASSNQLTGLNLRNGNNTNMSVNVQYNPDLLCIQVDDASVSHNWYKNAYTSYSENCSDYVAEMTYVPDDKFEQALIDLGLDVAVLNDSVPTVAIKNLKSLNVAYKNIIDLTGIEDFVALEQLYCFNNQISEINLTTNTNLKTLAVENNKLSDLDLSSNPFLTSLNASSNQLTGLNLRNGNNTNMSVNVKYNPDLLCIQVDDASVSYNWYKNAYTSYSENCSDYVAEMTYVPDDKFEQALIDLGLDVAVLNDSVPTVAIKNLKSLNVAYKNIIDLTGIEDFVALEQLYCNNNQISEIDLKTITNLKTLQIQNNKLSELDLSSNPFLTSLSASSNQLTGINLRNGNNTNMSVNVQYNPDLLCIQVDDPVASYEYTNWYKNAYTSYSESCSGYIVEMTYVPDDNFEQALINLSLDFDDNLNDSVPTVALHTLTGLYLDNKSIYSFQGIQDCINLKYFYCRYNFIDSLDLSNNPKLIELDCSNNYLEELDISANRKLTELICNNNSLTRIVFSKHDLLEFVSCSNNGIEEISGIESSSLTTFYCDKNKLTKLIVDKLPALTTLVCRDNNLNELDVSSNSQLRNLTTERNLLTFINLQNGNNQNLYLYAYENLPACIQVDDTIASQNKPDNEWFIDDWSYYSENCTGHHVDMVYIPDDNFEQALLTQKYDDGILNDSVPKAIVETIQGLNIDDSNISDLTGIENFINLTGIRCNNNKLTKLDLSKNFYLQNIRCENNKIDSLNISTCLGLTDLFCSYNLISEIDVSSFPYLYRFSCNENKIVNLDVSNNPDLYYFVAYNNDLSSLNLKNRNNLNLRFNVTNNPNLFCIEVDDVYAATQNTKWYKDEIAIYSEDCSNKSVMTYIPDDNFEQALINSGYDSGELNDSVPTVNIYSVSNLSIQNRSIESLEGIQDFELLRDLNCSFNQIQELDLSNNNKLNSLRANNNNLHKLNFRNGNNSNYTFNTTNNPKLTCIEVDDPIASESYFNWYKDEWTSYSENCIYDFRKTYIPDDNFEQALIDLGYDSGELDDSVLTSNIVEINDLNISNKNISSLQGIEAFSNLYSIDCSNNTINQLNLNNNKQLTLVVCRNNQILELLVDSLLNLEYLDCVNNKLTTIDISYNPILSYLDCSVNQLAALNVKSNLYLVNLFCHYNQLTELDLHLNQQLTILYCGDNQILTLDLSKNKKLTLLYCHRNNLSELNIKNGYNRQMSFEGTLLNAQNNPNLTCIQVDNPIASESYTNWYKDDWASYSEDCSSTDEMTYIPDDNFEQALIDLGYDSGALDNFVLTANIDTITVLNVASKKINNLTGIEKFKKLKKLNCGFNSIEKLDLSSNKSLTHLQCFQNKLTSLNINDNSDLVEIRCENNFLTELNFNSTKVEEIRCYANSISHLDLKNLIHLKGLYCFSNLLNSLNVGDCTELEDLECGQNPLSALDISNNLKLTSLICSTAQIEHFNSNNNPLIKQLHISANKLETLDVSNLNLLEELFCSYNSLSKLDLTDNPHLRILACNNNQLSELNLKNGQNENIIEINTKNNTDLLCVQVDNVALAEEQDRWFRDVWTGFSADCSNYSSNNNMVYVPDDNFEQYFITNHADFGSLNDSVPISAMRDIQYFWLSNRNIKDLTGIEKCTNLKILYCDNNQIKNLDLSQNKELTELYCYENQITNLNLSANTKLHRLVCSNNHLTNLNLNKNPYLVSLECQYNSLENLNLSNNTQLDTMFCNNNLLTSVNIQNGNNNNLYFADFTGNENLTCIQVDNVVEAQSQTGWIKDEWSDYAVSCGAKGAGVPISEYNALVDFYNSTEGENWTNNTNWLDTISGTVEDWWGITIVDGHVHTLALDTNNVSGPIPESIGDLSYMHVLGLANNNLTGEIPSTIGNLNNLSALVLWDNALTGVIPATIGNLTNLIYLALNHNNIGGTIPSSLGNLVNLRYLTLFNNNLVGPVPIELQNLAQLSHINLDNNQIGKIGNDDDFVTTKAALIENNRQIPDELSELLEIDTLHLGGNNLQFNDIEAIFSWENYGEFKEFIYAPQDSIGITKTENKITGESAILSIDNYFQGPSDRYQWYKNGDIIPGATSAMLNLNTLQNSDAGQYYCKITNPVVPGLTLYSRKITVKVSEGIKGAGVPRSEYEALVAIYNSTNGLGWTNHENWLDTVNYSVSEWVGITVENGNVTTINLSGLNLEGDFSSYFTDFDSLKRLDLSNNKLSGEFPGNGATYNSIVKSDESSNQILKYLDISNNNFVFAELEPAFDFFQTIDTFIYAPQFMVGLPFDTTIYKNQPVTFRIANYTPGSFDSYSWSKDGTEITDADEITFVIQNAAPGDSGYYTCSITNLLFPELTLLSDASRLNVLIPVGIDDFNNTQFNIYPNPAEKQIFVETGNKPVNLKLFDITGTLIFGKDDFMSGWINIEPFTRGIYFIRITRQNSEAITKKVILK